MPGGDTAASRATPGPLEARLLKPIRENWFSVDPRSLAFFRITFALILLTELAQRWPLIDVYYNNLGAISNFTLAAASSVMLVSIIKPILLLPQFVIYTRIASSSIEKDARYLNLGVNKINLIMLCGGIAAYACGLLVPVFWIGWPVSILLLVGFLFGYMQWRNAKVPDAMKFELIGTRIEDARKARQSKRAEKSVDLHFIDGEGKERAVPLIDDPLHDVH